jgi:hypothetical protein
MPNTMQCEIHTENQLIRIKNKDFSLNYFRDECLNWGLKFVSYYTVYGKIYDATFEIVDIKKYMLFLIKHPIKIYPISD